MRTVELKVRANSTDMVVTGTVLGHKAHPCKSYRYVGGAQVDIATEGWADVYKANNGHGKIVLAFYISGNFYQLYVKVDKIKTNN